jgi:hypothetical protein
MNRAWIPAGALAGVSVAGLLALAPLTDSLGTQVDFPNSVPVSQAVSKPPKVSVPVSVNLKTVGKVTTAAFSTRGGQAGALSTSSDNGLVGNPSPSTTSQTQTAARTTVKTATEPAVKPKKTVQRPSSIGTAGESNSNQGFAGGNDSSTGLGEQSGTPGG